MSGLSNYEISAMKRLIKWQDEAARQENLVIRGINLFEDWRIGVKRFMKEKLAVDVNVVNVRKNGSVYVIKFERKVDRDIVLQNKYKLKRSKFFIELDMNYEEKKRQENLSKWVKEKKLNGWQIKSSLGGFWMNERWYKWLGEEAAENVCENEEKIDNNNGYNRFTEKNFQKGPEEVY